MKKQVIFFSTAVLLFLLTIASLYSSIKEPEQITHEIVPSDVFIYVLQGVNYGQLRNTDFGIAVVDPDDSGLNKQDLTELNLQNKIMLAYLSIGEAEDYRSYWQSDWKPENPEFLAAENPAWEGNFKVEYWNPKWQEIVFNRVDEILSKGFNGVYLDIVDAYQYFAAQGKIGAKQQMIDFILEISERAKKINNTALIVPQNALELTEDRDYLSSISGVGKEDTWFDGETERTGSEFNTELEQLDNIIAEKKFVLVIDYPSSNSSQCKMRKLAAERGFLAYTATRELDTINLLKCQ